MSSRQLSLSVITPRALLVTALTLFLVLFMFMFGPQKANAHDVLVDQTPADGEILEKAPEGIVLSFNNKLLDMGQEATVIIVTDAEGNLVETGAAKVNGMQAVLTFADLADGAYQVQWSVVSSDGHPIVGAFTFAVGSDGASALETLPALGTDVEESHEQGDAEATDNENDGDDSQSDGSQNDGSQSGDSQSDATQAEDQNDLALPVVIGISALGLGVIILGITMLWRKSRTSR